MGGLASIEEHLGVSFPEVSSHPGNRSTSALRGHEGIYFTPTLSPNFRASGSIVSLNVVQISILTGNPILSGVFFDDFLLFYQVTYLSSVRYRFI